MSVHKCMYDCVRVGVTEYVSSKSRLHQPRRIQKKKINHLIKYQPFEMFFCKIYVVEIKLVEI